MAEPYTQSEFYEKIFHSISKAQQSIAISLKTARHFPWKNYQTFYGFIQHLFDLMVFL